MINPERGSAPGGEHAAELVSPLVLAEIELESDDEDVTFPGWLEPAIQREVTDEPEFQNINLAR